MSKKTAQLNIRIDEEDLKILQRIEEAHYINPSLLTRGLLTAAINFYREHGWFSFPVSLSCDTPATTFDQVPGASSTPPPIPAKKKSGNQTTTKPAGT